jgi:hypothetical protein
MNLKGFSRDNDQKCILQRPEGFNLEQGPCIGLYLLYLASGLSPATLDLNCATQKFDRKRKTSLRYVDLKEVDLVKEDSALELNQGQQAANYRGPGQEALAAFHTFF